MEYSLPSRAGFIGLGNMGLPMALNLQAAEPLLQAGGQWGEAVAAGHCVFGLGSTATAVAGMKALVEKHAAAPQAFLIVPLVGGFLVDLVSALNITGFVSLPRLH
ncbi:MAG TPA: hypothetical protein VGD97_07590 [Lacunisphaera sp.]